MILAENKDFTGLKKDHDEDEEVKIILEYISHFDLSKVECNKAMKEHLKKRGGRYTVVNEWLMMKEGDQLLLVIPKCRRAKILEQYHNGILGGHMSAKKTESKLRAKYYWPHITTCVKE